MDLAVGSYQPRSWWPLVKFMSSLWKMAAHWKGAWEAGCQLLFGEFGFVYLKGR